jgi:hypothetical protein
MTKQKIEPIKLTKVRLLYPALFDKIDWPIPDSDKRTTPKYECQFILDKQKHVADIAKVNQCIDEVLTPHKMSRERLLLRGYNFLPLRDGDLYDEEFKHGSYVLKASSQFMPKNVAKDGKTIITDRNIFYSGCYVNCYVTFYAMTKGDLRVGSNILAVQFSENGERIAGGDFNIEGKFDCLESDEDADFEIPFN